MTGTILFFLLRPDINLIITRSETINLQSIKQFANLIQSIRILYFIFVFFFSDDDYKDDDIIFEDFARLRLKGETEA